MPAGAAELGEAAPVEQAVRATLIDDGRREQAGGEQSCHAADAMDCDHAERVVEAEAVLQPDGERADDPPR